MQLDSADEQAAAIRRELDGRMQKVNEMEKVSCNIYVFETVIFPSINKMTLLDK